MAFNLDDIRLGKIRLDNPFVLAPMAGVNCSSFRLLCRESGAGLVYTQMYHCNFIINKEKEEGAKAVYDYVNILALERPVAIQIVGHTSEDILEAAKILEKKADLIDINLGCCDPDLIKSGCGAYFTKYPEKIKALIRPLVKELNVPITAKIRIGWDSQSINGVKMADILEKAGVAAIAVHGRTAAQKYAGKANWEIIRHIKKKLSIPVIGNGDVNNSRTAIDMLNRTGCDLVMIGRRAMGDPGIFTRCNNRLNQENKTIKDPKELFREFLKLYEKYDCNKSFTEIKEHAMWYSKRARLGPNSRSIIARADDIEKIRSVFSS